MSGQEFRFLFLRHLAWVRCRSEEISEVVEPEADWGRKGNEEKLEQRIKDIDLSAEHGLLSIMEWEERISTEEELENIDIAEETFWKQRAGTKWVLQGDTNSHFYHQFAKKEDRLIEL